MLVGAAGVGYGVSLVVAFRADVGTQLVVVNLVVVFAFGFFAGLFHEFHLGLAVFLDFGMGHLEGFEQVGFGNLVHFAFHHHDVVVGSAHHQFDVGAFHLVERGVDDPLAVHACHAHFGDGSVEGDVAASERCRSGNAGQCVGSVVLVSRI